MAYRFKRKESIAAAFARLAAEQIARAIGALEKPSEERVHEARRCIKRLRALLRLFRRALPDGTWEREDSALRSAGRKLSAVREAQVQFAVFEKLASGFKLPGLAGIRRDFAQAVNAATAAMEHTPPAQAAGSLLRTVQARLPGLKPDAGWSLLARCLKAAYRRARKAHAAAHASVSAESLHRWRRRGNEYQCQMQLLRKLEPKTLQSHLRKISRLNAHLGDDHDLAVLDRRLAGMAGAPAELRAKLRGRIAKRRRKLQRRAFALGSELFFEKPSVVVKGLASAWKRWRGRK